MKNFLMLIILSLLFEISVITYARGSAENTNFLIGQTDQITEIIKGLKKRNCWFEDYYRPVGILYQIIKNNQWIEIERREREDIEVAFFDLLELVKQSGTEKVEGEEGNKWVAQLYYIAGELKDPRAIPFLIKELGANGAQEALVKIGAPAIEEVIKADASVRWGAITVMGIWISGGTLTQHCDVLGRPLLIIDTSLPIISTQTTKTQKAPLSRIGKIELNQSQKVQIKNCIIRGLEDECPEVRVVAIQSLGSFGDPDIIPIIKPYLNDPYSYIIEKTELRQEGNKAKIVKLGEETIYPVREEAQRVIKLLEEKKKEEEREKTIRENPSHP